MPKRGGLLTGLKRSLDIGAPLAKDHEVFSDCDQLGGGPMVKSFGGLNLLSVGS